MRIILAACLALLAIPSWASPHNTTVITPKTVAIDTAAFCPRIKSAMPDIDMNEGETFGPVNLNVYGAAGDVNVTASPVAGDIAPTITLGGDNITGDTLTTTDKNNATYTIAAGASSSGAFDITFTYHNSVAGCSNAVDTVHVVIHDSGSPSGAVAIAEGSDKYFVDTVSGNDTFDGKYITPNGTHGPWKTIPKVNGNVFATSSDVYLKAGQTFTGTPLTVDWNGTSGDHVKIGTYYVSSGQPFELAPDNPTAFPTAYTWGNGARAIIRGNYDNTCSPTLGAPAGSTCTVNTGGAVPATWFAPLVAMRCNYCDVQSLDIRYSAGRAIDAVGAQNSASFTYHDIKILNNKLGPAFRDAIVISGTQHGFVSGNVMNKYCVGSSQGDKYFSNGSSYVGTFASDAPGGNTGVVRDADILIEKNDFSEAFGTEGFIVSQIGHVVLRGNRIQSAQTTALYTQTCYKCVYEFNVVYGGKPGNHSSAGGYGIGITAEDAFGRYPDTDIIIRGNMVAFQTYGLRINPQTAVTTAGIKISVRNYGNTVVDLTSGVHVGSQSPSVLGAGNIGTNGIDYKDNIFYNEAGFVGSVAETIVKPAGVTFDYNFWSSTPTDGDAIGAHDTVASSPSLVGSGFNTKTVYTTAPAPADFALQAGSAALAHGTALTSVVLDSTEFPEMANSAYPFVPNLTEWQKAWTVDAAGRAVDATPDLGSQGR